MNRCLVIVGVALLAAGSHAQLISNAAGHYMLFAYAEAGSANQSSSFNETQVVNTWSRTALAAASDQGFSANAQASAEWSTSAHLPSGIEFRGDTRMSSSLIDPLGGVTIAETSASLDVIFLVNSTTTLSVDWLGTANSQIDRLDNNAYIPFLNASQGNTAVTFTTGIYRWLSQMNHQQTLPGSYSARQAVELRSTPVPEPATMLALAGGFGTLVLRRKRRSTK